jgi:hypothetical protein
MLTKTETLLDYSAYRIGEIRLANAPLTELRLGGVGSGPKVDWKADDWCTAYGMMVSFESALDAAGYTKQVQMQHPDAPILVITTSVSDDGSMRVNTPNFSGTVTAEEMYAAHGLALPEGAKLKQISPNEVLSHRDDVMKRAAQEVMDKVCSYAEQRLSEWEASWPGANFELELAPEGLTLVANVKNEGRLILADPNVIHDLSYYFDGKDDDEGLGSRFYQLQAVFEACTKTFTNGFEKHLVGKWQHRKDVTEITASSGMKL